MESFWFLGHVCTGTDPCFHLIRGVRISLFYGRHPISWLRRRFPVLWEVHTMRVEPRGLVCALKYDHLDYTEQNIVSLLNTTSCRWLSHQFKCAPFTQVTFVDIFFVVRASSQFILLNNQRSKVDNSSAELSQEYWWNGSKRHEAEMKVLLGYYITVGADIGHVLGVIIPVSWLHFRILDIDPWVILNWLIAITPSVVPHRYIGSRHIWVYFACLC